MLLFYIEKVKILQVITYNWKYINVLNSLSFLLSEFEEMTRCIHRIETANAGMEL